MERLFLSVLNMSITASFVIFFVILARLLLRKAPRIFSYSLWSIALFRLICPFSFSSALSFFRFVKHDTMRYIPANIGYMTEPQVSTGIKAADNIINSSLPAATPAASVNPMQILIAVGSFIWVMGVIALLIYSMWSYVLLKRKVSTAMLISDNIFECEKVSSPFVMGVIRPKIYIPMGLSKSEPDYILMHEQIHIRRYDYIVKPLAFLVLCLHWFNPLVWVSFVLMGHDMEMSCDERVLNKIGRDIKKEYSSSLLSFAAHRSLINVSPLAFGESNIKSRIKNVLNYKKPGFWVAAAAVMLVIAVGMGLMTNPHINKQDLPTLNMNDGKKAGVSESLSSDMSSQKVYKIPKNLQKVTYSVEDFKALYTEFLKLNNISLQTSPENDKTGMPEEDKLKYYTIYDITPQDVKKEIKCQLFKVNYTCETYIVYDSKVYSIGSGFGGYGVVDVEACDFDKNGQKDLIYTYSWGSGIHRSHIGVFNLSNNKEEVLDITQYNKDIMLEKVADNDFKVYVAGISSESGDFVNLKLSKQANIAEVRAANGKVEVLVKSTE